MAINIDHVLDKTGLGLVWNKIKTQFVAKELKTGSQDQYKVLSDNNLTDELVKKINDAGTSSFNGSYSALTEKPSIEGHEIASGNNTAASLGLATPTDISNATNDMATQTWVNQKGYATTQSVNTLISTAISSTYKAKGSIEFSALPALTEASVGDVYNISTVFVTTSDFVEGASKSYPAGTNVVCIDAGGSTKKWDVLAGFVDTSKFITADELIALSSTEIDEICK